jgi:hypothetical protein
MEGMAFGTGSAIAHRAVGAVFGSMGGGAPAAPAESTAQAATAPVSAKTIADKCAPYQQEVRRFCRRSNAYVSLLEFSPRTLLSHPLPCSSPRAFPPTKLTCPRVKCILISSFHAKSAWRKENNE